MRGQVTWPPQAHNATPLTFFQLLVVASHEFFHIVFGLLCGGSIVSVSVDPNAGGATHILGLMPDKGRLPQPYQGEMSYGQVNSTGRSLVTLTAGYIGSSIIGFFYVVSGRAWETWWKQAMKLTGASGPRSTLLGPRLRASSLRSACSCRLCGRIHSCAYTCKHWS